MKITRHTFLHLLLLALLLAGCAAPSYDATVLPLDPAVTIGKLDNGLTYYIRKNSKPENRAELRLVVNAGSIQEDDDQRGLAHFAEHMAFNGSRDFKKNELVSYLQSIGVEFGADLNAYTSYDETVYMLSIPLQNPQHLDTGFKVLENWAAHLSFDGTEIDKERGVVLEELRGGKGADERMWKKIEPLIFMHSKYADRYPIGDETLLKTFPHEAVKRYYRDWYRPDLMAVIAVGDFDPVAIEKMIHGHFAALQKPSQPRAFEAPVINKRTEAQAMVVTDKEATGSDISVIYPVQNEPLLKNIGDYRDYTIQRLAQNMMYKRLAELTEAPNPPFADAAMADFSIVRHTVFPYFYATITEAGVEAALAANVREAKRVYQYGFTAAELDNAKKIVAKTVETGLNEKDKNESSNFADEYIRHYLAHEPIPGIVNEHAYTTRYLADITLVDVNRFIKTHIADPDHYLAVYTGPETASLPTPTEVELRGFIDNVAQEKIKPYSYKELPDSLMAAKPIPGSIVVRKEITDPALTEITLSNGIKLILKPTVYKNDQVVLHGFRKGGQYLYPDSDQYAARYASTLVREMGVANFSPINIANILAGKNVYVYTSMGYTAEIIDGFAGKNDVEALLQLLYLQLTNPRKDEALFKSYLATAKIDADHALADPQNYFYNERLGVLYNHHPRAPRYISRVDLDKISLDRAFEIYQQRFGDASDFTFVIVGAFTIENITPLIETYIASLPTSDTVQQFGDVGLRPVQGVVKKNFYKGRDEKSNVSIVFSGETEYSRNKNLQLALLTDVLNIKIMESLRENLAAIYSGGVYGSISKEPYQRYTVNVTLPCSPENADKVVAAFWQEVNHIKQQGPSAGDLHKVQETMIQTYLAATENNYTWAQRLEAVYDDGEAPAILTSAKERILAVTVADLQQAARLYLDDKNYVQTVLYPEKAQLAIDIEYRP